MNYSVNMPDWHQYNSPQSVRGPSSALSSTSSSGQNANGRVYMAGAGSPALDGMNLTNERHRASAKHQTDASYVPARNYPVVPGAVHMSGNMATCVTPHYGQSVRNPMMDGLSPLGIPPVTDEAHRNAQMGYAPPTSVNQPPGVVNAATAMSSMGSQGSPLGSASPGRAGVTGAQPYAPCKAPCCNPDPGIYHQHWDKFAHYPASYREAIRQPSGYQPMDARLFLTKAHKDCLENKDIIEPVSYPGDHRGPRAFTDYNKYARKESLARNYPSASNGIPHQNYPMQNYQFSGSEYQKCPYTGKDYGRRGANQSVLPSTAVSTKNPNMLKYHEQQSVIVQKYQHSKQMQYQNSPAPNSALVSAPSRSNANTVSPALQNSYFNPGRDYSQDYSAQDQSVVANRMAQSATGSHVHGSFQKYHVYHQKIAMQRYSLENHLRAFSRMPGYQTHPKYQECVMRYRELLRLQQTVDYQNVVQESPKVPSPTTAVPTGIAPINLQFDQNGVLINSSYIPSSGAYAIPPPAMNTNAADINGREAHDDRAVPGSNENFENPARFDREAGLDNGRLGNREPGMKIVDPTRNENAQGYFRNEKKDGGYEQRSHETERTTENQTFVSEANDEASPVNSTMEYRNSKDFADKPELDVRQFLANWDESEDEESTIATSLEATEGPREIPTMDANEGSPEKPVTRETLESSSFSPEKETHLEPIKIDGTLSLNNIRDIACVRSADDMDDIPTIHIVENLDGGAEIEKIHTVFGNLASAVLEPISICENSSIDDNANGAETIVLFEHQEIGEKSLEFGSSSKIDSSEIVEGVMASILESVPTGESEVRTEETRADEERPEVESAPPDAPEEQAATEMSGDDATSTATTSSASSSSNVKSNDPPETTSLRKQSSFTSDESHNPDDISLPDLQTSECTPISTTLNTPIHSDSEESTEHVTDLTISTNPIEIIQNSPIISFTHSPIKIEPYEQLDRSRMVASTPVSAEHPTLDFDFDEEVASNENRKYNETCDSSPESVVEELENEARGHAIYEKRSVETNLTEQAGEKAEYYHDPLVDMAPLTSPRGDKTRHRDVANVVCDDTNVTAEQAGENAEYYHDPLVGMAPLTSPRGDKSRHRDVANVVCDDTNVPAEQTGDKADYYHDPLVGMAPLTSPRGDKTRHRDVANVVCDDTNVTAEQAGDKVNYYHDPLVGMAPLTSPRGDKTRHHDVANVACDDTNVTTSMTRDNVDDFNRSEDLEKLCDMSLDDDIMPLIPDDVACDDEPRMPVSPMEENCLTNILNDTLPITDLDMLDTSGNEIIDKTNGEDDLWGQVRRMDYAVEPEARKFSAKPTKATMRMEKTASEKATELADCTKRDTSRKEAGESSKDEETGKTRNQSAPSDRRDSEKNEETKITKHHHVDSNVEIQVANFNVKIHNDTEKRCGDGGKESIVEGVDAIEIKINLSRGDVVRMINKEGKFNAPVDVDTTERKRRNDGSAGLEKIRCRRRRRSMPESFEDFESKRMRRDEDHCSARRLTKHRRNRKIRRSMDDKLLLDEPHSTRENSTSSSAETNHRDFHEISDSRSLSTTKDNDRQWEETTKSTRNKVNVRLEKLKDSRRLPSPSYNSVDNSSTLDFDNFDVAPNRDSDEEKSRLADEPRYARDKFRTDGKYESSTIHASRLDDFSSINALERNLNTVPIYTTKDGRITYSPNSNYTYRALIIEARQRAKHSPAVRKAHHPRNSYRDATTRKNLFKTSGRKAEDKKSRDYPKSRRTSKLRRDFFDDANERPEVRSKKYENRRNASAERANFRNEDRAKEDTSKARRLDKTTEKCHSEHREPELPVPDPRSISDERLDTKMADSACLTCDETTISIKSPSKLSIEDRAPIVEKIFQGREFEISRTPKSPIADKIESPEATLRFFRDNLAAPRPTIMASPSTRLVEKRPQIWDLECQTALSDSGLESSTTYVEASKESRKLQKWKNSFVDRVESAKSIFSVSQDGKDETRYVASEIVHARQNPEAKSYRTLEKDEAAEAINIAEPALPAENIPEKFHGRIDDSEIVERLDLAVPPCDLDEAKTRCRKKKERDKRAARIFNESSTLTFRRCVSNDGGEFAGLSFEIPKISDRRDCEESITATIEENKVSEEIHDEIFSRSCTDCTMDFTSFSTSAKLPESASSTRMTAPQLEDTSTRFASESMDFSDVYGRANDENSAFSSRGTCFLSRLDENALDPSIDCSRRSSDSGHSKDSRKAPILSFSGQIQSDSSLINESKSPPDLTHENECAVQATNETVEKSIDEQPDSGVLDEKVRRNASHPKIPKMIIRNIRSRPGTPTTVEDVEKHEDTSPKVVPDVEKKTATTETKIPKMKIKLDDHLPRMIVDTSKSSRPDDKKIKSKKVSKSSNSRSPSANEKLPLLGKLSRQSPEKEARDSHENTENSSGSYKFTLVDKSTSRGHHRRNRSVSRDKGSSRNHHHHHRNRSRSREKLSEEAKKEKIPKLTIKKQSQSSNTAKKPRSESPGEAGSKKRKGSAKPFTKKEESRSHEKRRTSLDSNESNNDSSLAEKVPKVIIKRTSPSAEFKCELSKSDRDAIIKDSKWQPEVKLRRFWVLDCMAKEPGNGQVALKVLESTLNQGDKETISESTPRKNRWNRSSSDAVDIREKMYEGKMRRRSDCDLSESSLPTCNNRRKSFESENIEFTDHAKNEHFSFTPKTARSDKLGDKSTEKTGGRGSLKKSQENPDENNSVIKLDSSDESQTTIELLPASLENSQLDTNNQYFTANGDMGKLYSEDAIPTQFELELEIVDNSVDSLDVAACSVRENYEESAATDLGCEKYARADRKKASEENGAESIVDTRNVCCSDSLVKEVLAAKETLKRCLMTKSESLVARRTKPRPKTAAEKKQGSCDYVVSEDSANDRNTENGQIRGFQGNREESSREKLPGPREDRICPVLPFASAEARKETREEKTPKRLSGTSRGRARSSEVSSVAKSLKRSSSSTSRDATNKTNKLDDETPGENSRTKGIASVRKKSANSVENKTEKEETTTSRKTEPCDEVDNNVKSYKIPKISRSKEPNGGNCGASSTSTNNGKTVAANDDKRKSPSPAKMPILEPQVDLNFELAQQRDADRDTSRSPPVITKQEESLITVLTPKKIEDNVDSEKLGGIEKQRDNEAVTFADIVSQLAYHEKATIRHRRYCTLCERWFPTAARHRRHLTGYQHRHTELTQRRTVHALFMLFTGKPCPRLLPASIVRTDCLPGEPTPLQIAVQDVAISLEDSARAKPSKDATDKHE